MTGILGGTFDPPHSGHLVLALEALERFELERLLLVPSRIPPHKDRSLHTPFEGRMEMTRLAVSGLPGLEAVDLEPEEGPSYTVSLLESLASRGMDVCFVMGMDSFREIGTWREPRRLSRLARVVVGTRPGFQPPDERLARDYGFETFPIPGVWISSSELRSRFAQGRNTRYLVPAAVRDYVLRRGLYADRAERH